MQSYIFDLRFVGILFSSSTFVSNWNFDIMKKVFYLKTCSTCQRILKEWNLEGVTLREIKSEPVTPIELEQMKALSGSFEAIFSKKSMKYRAMGLHERTLSEDEMRQLILEEYTFLKRPVLLLENEIFIGNSKNVVESAAQALNR